MCTYMYNIGFVLSGFDEFLVWGLGISPESLHLNPIPHFFIPTPSRASRRKLLCHEVIMDGLPMPVGDEKACSRGRKT